jgi:hypothetical protein
MNKYNWIDAIKNKDTWYFRMIPREFYFDHIYWRIHHYFMNERCETCRNWKFYCKFSGKDFGTCDMNSDYYEYYHAWCPVWNLEPKEDVDSCYTRDDDGYEREWITPCGRTVTQKSCGGVWIYQYEGEPKWMKELR